MSEQDWDWKQLTEIPVATTVADARFVLACCCQWIPDGDVEIIAKWEASDYDAAPILRLAKKMLPLLVSESPADIAQPTYTVGEISYVLHFLRGDDSYGGGGAFERELLKALWELVKTE